MSEFSDYLENALINHVFRNTALTSPTTVYAALFTTATNDAGGGTEVTGNAYARTAITFNAPSAGVSDNAVCTFPAASGGNWGTVTHFAIMDASTAGNMLMHSPLDTSRVVNDGDTFEFPATNVTVTLQ